MPLLSITMPTRNRPELFERALTSVVQATASVAEEVEVTVSDGSSDESTGAVVRRLLTGWPGEQRYVWNRPALEMVDNMNRAIGLARGEWVHQLHDDDYLLPGAGALIVDAIRAAAKNESVLLFGVEIVDVNGVRRRRRKRLPAGYLEPAEALRRLLRNSSFVRQPGVVARRSAYDQAGPFDAAVGGPTDLDMWLRLFGRYGVRCIPDPICAYTVHDAAATAGMWHPGTIEAMDQIFDRGVALGVVPESQIRRWQSDYVHQFILAGAYRRLKRGERAAARDVLRLFDVAEVRKLGPSAKWLAARVAFAAITASPLTAPRRSKSES